MAPPPAPPTQLPPAGLWVPSRPSVIQALTRARWMRRLVGVSPLWLLTSQSVQGSEPHAGHGTTWLTASASSACSRMVGSFRTRGSLAPFEKGSQVTSPDGPTDGPAGLVRIDSPTGAGLGAPGPAARRAWTSAPARRGGLTRAPALAVMGVNLAGGAGRYASVMRRAAVLLVALAALPARAADYPTNPDEQDKLCEVIGEAPSA